MPPVDRNADYEKETAAFRIFRQGPRRPFTGSSLPDHGLAPAVPSALKEETNAPFFMTTHDRSAILHPSLMAPAQALISDGAKWIDTSPGSPQVRCRFLLGRHRHSSPSSSTIVPIVFDAVKDLCQIFECIIAEKRSLSSAILLDRHAMLKFW